MSLALLAYSLMLGYSSPFICDCMLIQVHCAVVVCLYASVRLQKGIALLTCRFSGCPGGHATEPAQAIGLLQKAVSLSTCWDLFAACSSWCTTESAYVTLCHSLHRVTVASSCRETSGSERYFVSNNSWALLAAASYAVKARAG